LSASSKGGDRGETQLSILAKEEPRSIRPFGRMKDGGRNANHIRVEDVDNHRGDRIKEPSLQKITARQKRSTNGCSGGMRSLNPQELQCYLTDGEQM